MMMRRSVGRAAVVLMTALPFSLAGVSASAEGIILGAGHPDAISDSYLVVYRPDAPKGLDLRTGRTIGVVHTYASALHGFSATMDANRARELAAHPDVAFVEQNRTVRPAATRPVHGVRGVRPAGPAVRVPSTGLGVTSYVIDTGILTNHTLFDTRASWGTNTTGDGINADCNGHGTHVAGIVGGSLPDRRTAGSTSLVAVKVLGCNGAGTLAGVAAGVDWVTAHRTGPSVANMSLGSLSSATVDQAVRNSVASGVTYVVAAGNSNTDACLFSPAAVTEAITVGAAHDGRRRAWFSNHGTCLDTFAPGVGVRSAWHTGPTATATLSGTSMAAPSVAARAAMYVSANLGATPAQVAAELMSAAEVGQVVDPGPGSPNRFLGSLTSPPPAPPTMSGLECESYNRRIMCSAWASGVVTDIWWLSNGVQVGSGQYSLTIGCSSGANVTIRAIVGNPGGAGERSQVVSCWSGPPI